MKLHGPVVAVKVRLTFCTVDDEGIDLAETGLDLECGGEHCAAHADDACFTQTCDYRFGILKLFLGEGSHVLTRGILIVVFDNDCRDHVAQRMGSGLDCYYLAGDGRMYRSRDRGGIFADLLTHGYIVAYRYQRLARCADVLCHRNNDLGRRGYDDDRLVGGLHVVGMYAATEFKGHLHHLSIL